MGEVGNAGSKPRSDAVCVVVYGFDWLEEQNIGGCGWYMEECAKTITSTKPGAVLVYDSRGNGGVSSHPQSQATIRTE